MLTRRSLGQIPTIMSAIAYVQKSTLASDHTICETQIARPNNANFPLAAFEPVATSATRRPQQNGWLPHSSLFGWSTALSASSAQRRPFERVHDVLEARLSAVVRWQKLMLILAVPPGVLLA